METVTQSFEPSNQSGPSQRRLNRLIVVIFFLLDYTVDLTAIIAFQSMNEHDEQHVATTSSVAHLATWAAYFWIWEYICHHCLPRFPGHRPDREAEILLYGSAEDDVASSLAMNHTIPRVALMLALAVGYSTRWGFLKHTGGHTISVFAAWLITRLLWALDDRGRESGLGRRD